MIIAGTGHRPDKLGGYSPRAVDKLDNFAYQYLTVNTPTEVISGFAQGWDQALAWAAIQLKIPLTAAIPFPGQENQWPVFSHIRYNELLRKCTNVHYISKTYSKQAYQDRNIWMVDHCDQILALWNGSSGGTENCIKYANSVTKPVDNIWPSWILYGLNY